MGRWPCWWGQWSWELQGPVDKTRDRFGSRLNPIRQLNVIYPDMLLTAKILSLGKPCNPLNFSCTIFRVLLSITFAGFMPGNGWPSGHKANFKKNTIIIRISRHFWGRLVVHTWCANSTKNTGIKLPQNIKSIFRNVLPCAFVPSSAPIELGEFTQSESDICCKQRNGYVG